MFGRRSQNDFEDEIRSHLQLEVDRLKAQGMSSEDAERMARRAFGNVGVAEDRFYHAQKFAWVQDAGRDLRHAWRSMLRTPGFLVASIGTLALAMGAVAGMFAVVNAVMLRPPPFVNPERLVFLMGTAPGSDLPKQYDPGVEFYIHYRERSKLIESSFAFSMGMSTFRTDQRAERVPLAWPTNDMYKTLGVRPQLGRLPIDADQDDAVVISDRLWTSWFARDSSVIGKWFFVSDSMKQVIGVMPADFHFPLDETLLWVSGEPTQDMIRLGSLGMPIVARMKQGVTTERLATELASLTKELPERFGQTPAYVRMIDQHRPLITPIVDRLVGPTLKTSLLVLLGAVAVVLLIACANVANLFLVRAESRRRDLTVRRAIGASTAQLMRFQMAEAFAIALVSGVLALMLAAATLPLFLRAAPEGIPRVSDVRLDLPTIVATFGLVVLVALACGAAPAFRASSPDLTALREGGRSATGRRRWARTILVVGQTALALTLLIGSALLMQSFQRLRNVNPGYDVKDLYTFQYAPQQAGLGDGPSYGRFHLNAMARLRALPGVSAVGLVNNIPLDESTNGVRVRTPEMSADAQPVLIGLNAVGGEYFNALRIPLLQGRLFTDDEAFTPNNSVLVSRTAAEKLWPGQNPLGRSLRPRFNGQDTVTLTVVGVVGDVKQDDWRDNGEAALYLALTGPTPTVWRFSTPAYVVKSARPETIKPEVRAVLHEIAPEAPVYREFTMEFLARRSMIQLSFTTLTLGVVSALALILGIVGLYGVLSYVVAQRTREIGVRMALGATAAAVRRQVVTQGARVVVVGVVIGIGAAFASTRLLGTLLFGVKAVDPIVFAAMSLVMVAMGVLASYMPARRASSVDPIEALRSD